MKKQLLLFMMMLLPMVVNADQSGTCGNNVTWNYEEAKMTLTITGKGPIDDYSRSSGSDSSPWYACACLRRAVGNNVPRYSVFRDDRAWLAHGRGKARRGSC